ncbi:MAG: YwaF family protein [Bacilli bacterium]|nr:YwaF family protein [Bacilli bacterium]
MKFIELILDFLNGQMNTPVPYQSLSQSWFHYLALSSAVLASVLAVRWLKKADESQLRRFLLVFASLLLTFEVYKQLIFSFQADWNYQWYIFPFQFCSTPMYIALIAGLTKNKKIQQAFINFLATYGFFAGLAAMIYPNDVFVATIGINIQTMIHHGAMMVVGIALLLNKVKLVPTSIVSATAVFSVLAVLAILLNFVHNTWIAEGTFNMFFINPQYNNHLPVLTSIEPLVPHFVFVLIYIVGFAFVAYLMLLLGTGILAVDSYRKSVNQKFWNNIVAEYESNYDSSSYNRWKNDVIIGSTANQHVGPIFSPVN